MTSPNRYTAARANTLALLAEQDALLTDALHRLYLCGLESSYAAVECRRYRSRVRAAIGRAHNDSFNALAGTCGENGWAPGVRDVVRQAEFELNQLAPVLVISPTRVAA